MLDQRLSNLGSAEVPYRKNTCGKRRSHGASRSRFIRAVSPSYSRLVGHSGAGLAQVSGRSLILLRRSIAADAGAAG